MFLFGLFLFRVIAGYVLCVFSGDLVSDLSLEEYGVILVNGVF